MRSPPLDQFHTERVAVLEAGGATQHGDGWGAFQNAFVLGVAQFVDTTLLLGEQPFAQDKRRRGGQSAIKRTFAAQMGHVRGANHDLGGHAADVDAGAADDAALDQGDAGPPFYRLERGRHGGATTADNRHVKPVTLFPGVSATAQPAPCLIEQAGTGR